MAFIIGNNAEDLQRNALQSHCAQLLVELYDVTQWHGRMALLLVTQVLLEEGQHRGGGGVSRAVRARASVL